MIRLSKNRLEMTEMLRQKRGAVLPLVAGIVLSVTLLLTSLLQMPGGIRHVALRCLNNLQDIYDAESALLAYLNGLPEDYFKRNAWNMHLPKVERSRFGPWAELSSGRIRVLAGVVCDSVLLQSYESRRRIYEGFHQVLNDEIMMAKPPLALQVKSGNRRILGRIASVSLWVRDGDLALNVEGTSSSCRFFVDGTAEIRGRAAFDTLRIYSRGPLYLRGVKIRWLEAFSEERIEISQGVEFSGVAVARHEVTFPNGTSKMRRRYPSFVMSLETSETPLLDSMLVPDFVEGKLKPFEWRLE